MTNNPTIDGVSRELLTDLIKIASRNVKSAWSGSVCEEARALLDAPAVERQKRTAHSMKSVAEAVDASRCYTVLTSDQCYALAQSLNNQAVRVSAAENAALQSTIAQLQARIAELESGRGEPVAWANGEQLKLCAASPREVQPNNPMMHNLPRNIAGSALQTEYCNTPLYTAPPAQVATLWEIRIPDEPQNPESPAEYFYAQNFANRDLLLLREGASVVAEYACLDATAALNGPAK